MAVFGYLPKQKFGLGPAFGAYFLYDFSIKIFLIYNLSVEKVSMSYLFFFSRYQTNFKIYLGSSSKAVADRETKSGRCK